MLITKTGKQIELDNITGISKAFPDDAFFREISSFLSLWFDDSKTQIEVKTSGSTGLPKSIYLDKAAMIKSAMKTQSFFKYRKGDNALLALPSQFIACKMMLIRAIVSELNLLLSIPEANPLKDLNEVIHFMPMTPFQLSTIINQSPHKLDFVKTILLGGSPVSKKLLEKIQSFASDFYLGYGMTETMSHVAIQKLNNQVKEECFYGLPGITFSESKNGTLIITADHLKAPVHTNDVVELINEKSFRWKGRIDNVINSGSVKIHAEILEDAIHDKFGLLVVYSSLPDDLLNNKVILILESSPQNNSFLLNEINTFIKDNYSKHHVPKWIYEVSKFEITTTGKISRKDTLTLALKENKTLQG